MSGSFTKGDQVKTGGSLARWDTVQKKWFGTSISTALGLTAPVTVVDIEATSSEIVYLLTTEYAAARAVLFATAPYLPTVQWRWNFPRRSVHSLQGEFRRCR